MLQILRFTFLALLDLDNGDITVKYMESGKPTLLEFDLNQDNSISVANGADLLQGHEVPVIPDLQKGFDVRLPTTYTSFLRI